MKDFAAFNLVRNWSFKKEKDNIGHVTRYRRFLFIVMCVSLRGHYIFYIKLKCLKASMIASSFSGGQIGTLPSPDPGL